MALPVLAVGAVDFDDPDAGGGQVAGQACPITAGPFDPDQADRAEALHPSQELCITHGCGGKALGAEQAADPVQRGRYVDVGMGVYTSSDGRFFYDGQGHPFHG